MSKEFVEKYVAGKISGCVTTEEKAKEYFSDFCEELNNKDTTVNNKYLQEELQRRNRNLFNQYWSEEFQMTASDLFLAREMKTLNLNYLTRRLSDAQTSLGIKSEKIEERLTPTDLSVFLLAGVKAIELEKMSEMDYVSKLRVFVSQSSLEDEKVITYGHMPRLKKRISGGGYESYDPGHEYVTIHQESLGLNLEITKEDVMWDQTGVIYPKLSSFADAIANFINHRIADIMNNAWAATSYWSMADDLEMFSTAHLPVYSDLSGSTYANEALTTNTGGITTANVVAMCNIINNWTNMSNEPSTLMPRLMVVSKSLMMTANQFFNQPIYAQAFGATADPTSAKSALYEGYLTFPFLNANSSLAWMILTDAQYTMKVNFSQMPTVTIETTTGKARENGLYCFTADAVAGGHWLSPYVACGNYGS